MATLGIKHWRGGVRAFYTEGTMSTKGKDRLDKRASALRDNLKKRKPITKPVKKEPEKP